MKFKYTAALTAAALCAAFAAASGYAQDDDTKPGRPGFGQHRMGPGQGGPRGPGRGEGPGISLERLDTDGDGLISRTEFLDGRLDRVTDMFERQDRDGDGLISAEDRGRHAGGQRRFGMDREAIAACVRESVAGFDPEDDDGNPEADLAGADTDGDGFLDLSEVSIALEARAIVAFEHLDTDASGTISSDEIAARETQQQAGREAMRACMREARDNA